jgi:hypothetical protein
MEQQVQLILVVEVEAVVILAMLVQLKLAVAELL